MIKLGIVGNGESAGSFAGASHFVENMELVAIGGRSLERVAPLAEKFGGLATSIGELAEMDLDCVAISTPPGLHATHALPFLDKGIHALVEKPMALCLADCDRMIEAGSRTGAKIMVTQTQRYIASSRKAREIIMSGRFGKVISVNVYSGLNYFNKKRTGWQLDVDLSGGGVTFNPFVHAIDLARYMAGSEIATCTGTIGYHADGYDVEGDVHCLATCEDGVAIVAEVDGYGHRPGEEINVIMEDAAIRMLPLEKRIDVLIKGRVAEVYGLGENGASNDQGIYGFFGYINHLLEMCDVIENDAPPTSDGANGRANVAVACEILESCGARLPEPVV